MNTWATKFFVNIRNTNDQVLGEKPQSRIEFCVAAAQFVSCLVCDKPSWRAAVIYRCPLVIRYVVLCSITLLYLYSTIYSARLL